MKSRIERITENEDRLDTLEENIKELKKQIKKLQANIQNFILLNKYYESKDWLNDKEAYEKKKIQNIKAGVLSEDAIWNMDEELGDLLEEMKIVINDYQIINKKD